MVNIYVNVYVNIYVVNLYMYSEYKGVLEPSMHVWLVQASMRSESSVPPCRCFARSLLPLLRLTYTYISGYYRRIDRIYTYRSRSVLSCARVMQWQFLASALMLVQSWGTHELGLGG